MCLEVVRTRAFAALLSDEVFADVDLEALQVVKKIQYYKKYGLQYHIYFFPFLFWDF